jgi:hypothetical protein
MACPQWVKSRRGDLGAQSLLSVGIPFSESGLDRKEIPAWAHYLIRLGNSWPYPDPGKRRIALVSMPFDSAAAALIALGV